MACVICKSENLENLSDKYKYKSRIFRSLFHGLVVKKCRSCGLAQIEIEDTKENNDKLFKYYQSDYRENTKLPSLTNPNTLYYKRGVFIANMIAEHVKDADFSPVVFEKGCGFGMNLMKVKEKFPNATLYTDEMDDHVKPFFEKIGIKLASWNGGGGDTCDIIIMSHVLEHFTNPLGEIFQGYKNLKAGGLFYIEVPNSLNFIEPHITFWTDKSFLRMYGDYLADKFILEEFDTWGKIMHFDDGENGNFQRLIQEQGLCKMNVKTPNGVYLRVLLRKRMG